MLVRELQEAEEAQMIADDLNTDPSLQATVQELRDIPEPSVYDPVDGLFNKEEEDVEYF